MGKRNIIIALIIILFVGFWFNNSSYVKVKYRDGRVNISGPNWGYLDTSGSSFVRGAWYDEKEEYMIINLSGINYHYCEMPVSVWKSFKEAESFGSYYNYYIKGNYDCRINHVPEY